MQCACGMEIKMTKIILASNNKGKIKEVKEICKDMQVEIVSMKEAGIDIDIEAVSYTHLTLPTIA